MALQCALNFVSSTYTAGATPPPQLSMTLFNPNAFAVLVLGVRIYTKDPSGALSQSPYGEVSWPVGPGSNVTVPALGTLLMGPVAFTVGSAANANGAQYVSQVAGQATLPQSAEPPQRTVLAAATVAASDGSLNEATPAALVVSYTSQPPALSQGGSLTYFNQTNFLTGLALGVL
jgi:hypothetical protein